MSIVSALIAPLTGVLDKVVPDATERARLAHEIATMSDQHAQQALLAQLEINKAEAASGSTFKGGWRPAVGWVCAASFAYNFLVYPIAGALSGIYCFYVWAEVAPVLGMGMRRTLLGVVVGVGWWW